LFVAAHELEIDVMDCCLTPIKLPCSARSSDVAAIAGAGALKRRGTPFSRHLALTRCVDLTRARGARRHRRERCEQTDLLEPPAAAGRLVSDIARAPIAFSLIRLWVAGWRGALVSFGVDAADTPFKQQH